MNPPAPCRATELEALLGDPHDPANPTGFAAVLEADERGEMLAAGEQVLHAFGLGAEFVPPEHGGRLGRLDHLVEVMRAVYRRDPSLGLGYGASSLIAAVTIWTSGDPRQQALAASLLRSGRRIAVAFHELAHGNDMAGTEFTAEAGDSGWLLSGRKEVVTNIRRADALVVLARTDPRPGPRSHTLMLVDRATVPPDGFRDLPRFATAGLRGVQLGGLEFAHVPVPESAALGPVGSGLGSALKALQITRTTLPAMASAALDTALRTAVDHLSSRTLYGGRAIDLPHVRSQLTGVFADLLRAEAFAAVGMRALHLYPRSASVYSAAVKYGVAGMLLEATDRLADLMGAHFYVRTGPRAMFQKVLRDLAPVGFGHIARAACLMSLLPQLPLLARRSWRGGAPASGDLFHLDGGLPPLSYDSLTVHAGGRDPVAASSASLADRAWDPDHQDLRALARADLADLTELSGRCASLSAPELGIDAPAAIYDLADRYASLLARFSWFQVWRHADDPFLADPAWLRAALHRSASAAPLPESVETVLFRELLDRHRDHRCFGLTARPLPVRQESAR